MSGYMIILDNGYTAEFPDANCWSVSGGVLSIGDGKIKHGDFDGDRHGYFRVDSLSGVIDLDSSATLELNTGLTN